MKLTSAKGTHDFLPEDKIVRAEIVQKLKTLFEKYGYNPLETPLLENYETLSSKYAGGAEILKETYTLQDQGKRNLGLRYDLTVPFARVVATNPNVKKPFKRYEIGPVFRDGPLKLGRYRQFDQSDCDVVGTSSLLADAELLAMASEFFDALSLPVTIYVNNRKLLNALLDVSGVAKKDHEAAILALDKLKKIGSAGVKKELIDRGISEKVAKQVLETFKIAEKSNEEVIIILEGLLKDQEGLNEIKELFSYLEKMSIIGVRLDMSLARGLSYYTGTVFEAFVNDSPITSSVAAGGRYDEMIGKLVGSTEPLPAVGISFGIDPILEAMRAANKIVVKKSLVQVFVIPIKTLLASVEVASELRAAGINTDIDMNGRGISKNLEYANTCGIPFVVFLGEKEVALGKVKLKDMNSGEEKLVSVADAVKIVKK